MNAQSQTPSSDANTDLDIAPNSNPSVLQGPTHDQIAKCAYEIYVKTGRKQGQCTQNWQQAEQSLRDHGQAIAPAAQHISGGFIPHSARRAGSQSGSR